jgi:hypothetical protein
MGIKIRLGAGAIVFLFWLTLWGVRPAVAEPSEACRDLAVRFATAPGQMDLKALATLGTCLTSEISERVGAPGPPAASPAETPPPPVPQGGASPPPTSQQGASPPQAYQYGDWPLPAPSMESWPSPNPW